MVQLSPPPQKKTDFSPSFFCFGGSVVQPVAFRVTYLWSVDVCYRKSLLLQMAIFENKFSDIHPQNQQSSIASTSLRLPLNCGGRSTLHHYLCKSSHYWVILCFCRWLSLKINFQISIHKINNLRLHQPPSGHLSTAAAVRLSTLISRHSSLVSRLSSLV